MQEVKIDEIIFANGISRCPRTSIDENLMEHFKNLIDIEKFKNILSSALKDACNKINTFQWGIELLVINSKDDLSNDNYIRIGCKIYQLGRYEYRSSVIFYDCHDKNSEFKFDYENLNEKIILLIVNDFFGFIQSSNAYLSVSIYKYNDKLDNYCEELMKNKKLYFDFIDYVDKELSYQYKENLAECDCIYYLVGKDIRLTNGQNVSSYDFKGLLKYLIIFRFIPNKLSEEEVFYLFDEHDIQTIIDHLKLLLY